MTMEKELTILKEIQSDVRKISHRLDSFEGTVNERFEKVDQRFEQIDQRFERLENKLDEEVRHLGVLMEDMDDKFTLMSEAQSVIQEVLETRVARIEEILEVSVA